MFGIWKEYYIYRFKKGLKKTILPLATVGLITLIFAFGISFFKASLEKHKPEEYSTLPKIPSPEKPVTTEKPSVQEQPLPQKLSSSERIPLEEPSIQEKQHQETPPTYPEISVTDINNALYEGDYERAIDLVKKGLDKDPYNSTFNTLFSQLMDELKVDFKFSYLPGRRKMLETRAPSDLVLTTNDPYYLTIHASDRCFLYIFQITSSGDLKQLFPSSRVSTSNPIPPGPLRIPDGADWFYLDNVPGIETIYLVASRWRHEPLEELLARVKAEREEEIKKDLIEKVLSRVNLDDKATDKLPGLVFGMLQFRHDSIK